MQSNQSGGPREVPRAAFESRSALVFLIVDRENRRTSEFDWTGRSRMRERTVARPVAASRLIACNAGEKSESQDQAGDGPGKAPNFYGARCGAGGADDRGGERAEQGTGHGVDGNREEHYEWVPDDDPR